MFSTVWVLTIQLINNVSPLLPTHYAVVSAARSSGKFLKDPPSRSLTVSGARDLALQHLTLQQILDYGVFGVPDGIDRDAADAVSLASQGDGARSAVVEVAVDIGLGDISHYDLSVFEAQIGTGKGQAGEHAGARKSGISLGAALAAPFDLNPSGRLSDWGQHPGTVQGLPLPAGAVSVSTQYYSTPLLRCYRCTAGGVWGPGHARFIGSDHACPGEAGCPVSGSRPCQA